MNEPKLRTLAAFGCALVLAGCSAAKFADVANLGDPRTIVRDPAEGTLVTLRQGGTVVVRLSTSPGDGNRWELAPLPPSPLAPPVRVDFMPADGPGTLPEVPPYSLMLARFNPPGTPDAPIALDASKSAPSMMLGDAVVRLRGVTPGRANVQLDYRRADQPGSAAVKTVRLDVAVVP